MAKFVGRRGDTPTQEFLRLESHFLFEHHFCLVRRANEKGHVEGLIGFARRNFMVPIPQIDDLEEFNEQLAQSCRLDLNRRLRGQPTTKQGLLEEEQQVLLPLPKQSFEARRVEPAKANSLSLVRFDTNDYSVPTAYAHHHVTAVGNIQEVRLIVNDRVVARHPRDWAQRTCTTIRCTTWLYWSGSRVRWTSLDHWRTGICRHVLTCSDADWKENGSPTVVGSLFGCCAYWRSWSRLS